MKLLIGLGIIVIFLFFYSRALEKRALYYPSMNIETTPADRGLKYEEVFFKASDGTKLHGWFVPADKPLATILYCHGNAGNISHRIEIAKMFHDKCMNFFIFDYRGFGKSEGSVSEKGTYRDAQAAYDYLAGEKKIEAPKIVIYGKSVGGPVAIHLAAQVNAGALISESSFTSTREMAKAIYPLLPFWLFISNKYDAYSMVDKVNMPKLFIHSRNDEIVPFVQGEKLFHKAREPKEFYIMNGGHNDAFYIYSEECMSKIEDFLKRYLK